MRILLDTNIIIYRETNIIMNYSIGQLFHWLDKLGYKKIIHPYTIKEIEKYQNDQVQETMAVKLQAYEVIKTIQEPTQNFLDIISANDRAENDKIDNYLLFEVFSERVDLLITQDKKLRAKAAKLSLQLKVLSIDQFIDIETKRNPEFVGYKILSVEKKYFGEININSPFFDSIKRDYKDFKKWFASKCDEAAYIFKNEDELLGFLYIKIENERENYCDIRPTFGKGKRLKIGTFKVESTGFRLGERFLKIIFDNALLYNVDEIYVTMFDGEEQKALAELFERWGFFIHGNKYTNNGVETVLVKKMNYFDTGISVRKNFPNMIYNKQKFILPILPQFHTTLLPDSKLKNENISDFEENLAHRYALQKVYISKSYERNIHPGDLIIFYRIGEKGTIKKYSSVLTTIGVIDGVVYRFNSKNKFIEHCENRSVFSSNQLNRMWDRNTGHLMVIKFIFVKTLSKKLILDYLRQTKIIENNSGPRPFTRISDEQFNKILEDSQTKINFY